MYESAKPEHIFIITFLQLFIVPILISSYLPELGAWSVEALPFLLFVVNIFAFNFLFYLQNIRHIIMYTTVLSNILGTLYLIC